MSGPPPLSEGEREQDSYLSMVPSSQSLDILQVLAVWYWYGDIFGGA